MRQVIGNLLDDAIKYTPSSGRVSVSVAPGPPGNLLGLAGGPPQKPATPKQTLCPIATVLAAVGGLDSEVGPMPFATLRLLRVCFGPAPE